MTELNRTDMWSGWRTMEW